MKKQDSSTQNGRCLASEAPASMKANASSPTVMTTTTTIVTSDDAHKEVGNDDGVRLSRKLLKKQKRKNRKKERRAVKSKASVDPSDENDEDLPTQKRRRVEGAHVEPSGPSERAHSTTDENDGRDANDDDDDDDDDDEMLLAAAAKWAGEEIPVDNNCGKNSTKTPNKSRHDEVDPPVDVPLSASPSPLQSYSLHITQLPYDASELDLRMFFGEHGCTVTSVRLVYDRDPRGQKTVFRGVAFVDVLDHPSYEAALKLNHKASIRGRKLNVRPTRSKEELAQIVIRTKELVQERIRTQRLEDDAGRGSDAPQQKDGGDNNGDSKREATKSSGKENGGKIKKDKKKGIVKDKAVTKKRKESAKAGDGSDRKPSKDVDDTPVKLSKKERNRRAAILLSLKSKGARKR